MDNSLNEESKIKEDEKGENKKTTKTRAKKKTSSNNDNSENNGWVLFQNGIKMPVNACGKKGIFCGYFSVINGIFSVEQIQQNGVEQQIFTTDNCDIEVGNLSNIRHIIFIGENFIHRNNDEDTNLKNATFITGLKAYELAITAKNTENSNAINNEKCIIVYPEKEDILTELESEKIYNFLSSGCDFLYNCNLLENVKYFKPYFYKNRISPYKCLTKLPIHKRRKKVLVIDFGTSNFTKNILNNYFDCTFCHYTETARSVFYLYTKKRIDGVIISTSLSNTDQLTPKIKDEMAKIIMSNIPVLGLEFGAVLMAEILGATTQIQNNEYCYNEYFIMNYKHKLLRVSGLYYKKIVDLPQNINQTFFDKQNNVAGFYDYHHRNIGYNFSFCFDTPDVANLLNDFHKLLK